MVSLHKHILVWDFFTNYLQWQLLHIFSSNLLCVLYNLSLRSHCLVFASWLDDFKIKKNPLKLATGNRLGTITSEIYIFEMHTHVWMYIWTGFPALLLSKNFSKWKIHLYKHLWKRVEIWTKIFNCSLKNKKVLCQILCRKKWWPWHFHCLLYFPWQSSHFITNFLSDFSFVIMVNGPVKSPAKEVWNFHHSSWGGVHSKDPESWVLFKSTFLNNLFSQ